MSLHYCVTPVEHYRWFLGLQGKPSIIQPLGYRCHCCLFVLTFFCALLAVSACAAQDAIKQSWRGQHHQAAEPLCTLVKEGERWREVWQKVGESPPRAWPEGGVAIVALDSRRPSGGYSLQIRTIEEGRLVVESIPPAGAATTVVTRPWLIALFTAGGIRSVVCSFPER